MVGRIRFGRRPVAGTTALSSVLQRSIVLAAALATLLFALPLGVAVNGIYRNQAISALARDAERLNTKVTGSGNRPDPTADLVIPQPEGAELGLYTGRGVLVTGRGPRTGGSLITQVGAGGAEQDVVQGGMLLVVVPVPLERGGYVIRAARPYSEVRNRTYATWALMLGLAGIVLVLVTGLARARARRIARPLQELALVAEAL